MQRSHGSAAEATRTLPIVFVNVSDPVGAGYVASLAQPGGNVTGFTFVEYGMSGKWLELLKEIAPRVTRVAVLRDPALAVGMGQLVGSICGALFQGGGEPDRRPQLDEIERAITDFARAANGCLIVTASPAALTHRKLIITLAAQHRLPTVYFLRGFVKDGGLISYGPDPVAPYGQAASYVDRILRREACRPSGAGADQERAGRQPQDRQGARPRVPASVLARADEVIE